jgi:hypothetical protein
LRGEKETPVAGALWSENEWVILLALQSHKQTWNTNLKKSKNYKTREI